MAALAVEATEIPEVKIVTPRRIGDRRGFFCETYSRAAFLEAGIDLDFVQDNYSYSAEKGILRGLHFQSPPFAQAKLVRVGRGRILDVAVDIRLKSPSFGRYVAVELSAENGRQLLVPAGFAHGFCTLTDEVDLLYKVTAPYAPAHDCGLAFDDTDLGIIWPFPAEQLILSDRDRRHKRLRDLPAYFD
jgi:dTDP-4-dehydrorhamnose 3,5-epimerase